MKKIYLLLTILTTAVIGLVFTSPSYAYQPPLDEKYLLSYFNFDYSIEIDYDPSYGYIYEVAYDSTYSGLAVIYQNNYTITNDLFGVDEVTRIMFTNSYPNYYSYSGGYWDFENVRQNSIYFFTYDDASSIVNTIFQFQFTSTVNRFYINTEANIGTTLARQYVETYFLLNFYVKEGQLLNNVMNDFVGDTNIVYQQGKRDGEIIGNSNGYNQARSIFGFFNTSTNNWLTSIQYGDIRYDEGLNADFDYFEWMRSALFLPSQVLAIEIWPGFQLGYFAFFTLLLGIVSFIFGLFGKGRK